MMYYNLSVLYFSITEHLSDLLKGSLNRTFILSSIGVKVNLRENNRRYVMHGSLCDVS